MSAEEVVIARLARIKAVALATRISLWAVLPIRWWLVSSATLPPEAMDLIIEAMRNTDEPMKERTKNAQWIVATMMASFEGSGSSNHAAIYA